MWVALRGNILTPTSSKDSISEWDEPMLCFGKSSQETSENGFAGFVTSVSLLSHIPPEPPTCQTLVDDDFNSTFLPLSTLLWHPFSHTSITEVQEDSLCSLSYHYVVLNRLLNYHDFSRLCRSLGGWPPNIQDLKNGVVDVETCERKGTHELWSEKEEEEEETVSEEVTATCPVFLLANNTLGWKSCLSEVTCSLCRVPVNTVYTLYGDVEKFDRHYTLKLIADEGFYFDGNATSTISKVEESWMLHSRLHQEQWRLHNGTGLWPLGRRLWYSSHGEVMLTLASCNILQFSSNDGVCLLRRRRCDGLKDSHDGSDEQSCYKRLLKKELSYDTTQNPYVDRGEKGSVWFNPILMHIGKIESEKGMALIEGMFDFKWNDPRVNFVDFKIINFLSCKDIWIPSVLGIARSGYSSGPTVAIKRHGQYCYAEPTTPNQGVRDLGDIFMGKYRRFLVSII